MADHPTMELTVNVEKTVSINYQSVKLGASVRLKKEVADLFDDLTTIKQTLESWIDLQVVNSAKNLHKLKSDADDIPF